MQFSRQTRQNELGFTLFELMIAIAIIAILTAIGMPTYQNYIQKAALIDMLQYMSPYKTAVELCLVEQGALTNCNKDTIGIPSSQPSRYVSSISVASGIITLEGKQTLSGLTAKISPMLNSSENELIWEKSCVTSPKNTTLEQACNTLFNR